MRRKILIAEQSDTVRSIAETVLRQNGYDVIAVTAAEKAREVLELSRPDLIIVGADLMAPNGMPYYERLRVDPRSAHIPMQKQENLPLGYHGLKEKNAYTNQPDIK